MKQPTDKIVFIQILENNAKIICSAFKVVFSYLKDNKYFARQPYSDSQHISDVSCTAA
jgi:hypothetical protein